MALQLNWLDWAVLTIIGGAAWRGFSRGLLGVAIGALGYFMAVVLAGRLSAPLARWLDAVSGASAMVRATLSSRIPLPSELSALPLASFPTNRLATVVQTLPIPPAFRQSVLVHLQALSAGPDRTVTVADVVFDYLTQAIVQAATFLFLGLILAWLLTLAAGFVGGMLDRLPLLGGANRLLGALLAAGVGVAVISMLLAAIAPLVSLPALQGIAAAEANSRLAPLLTEQFSWLSKWALGSVANYLSQP